MAKEKKENKAKPLEEKKEEKRLENKAKQRGEEKKEREVTLTGEQIMAAFQKERAKLEAIQRQAATMQNVILEMSTAINSLKEIGKTPKEEKILVGLGAGVYTDAILSDNKKAKESLPGNVMIDSDIIVITEKLEKRRTEAQKALEEIRMEEERVGQNLRNLGKVISYAEGQARAQQAKGQSTKQGA